MTERGTDSISTYAIDERGGASGPTTITSSGKTPYGFDFTADGAVIVTEAFGGAVGAAAASSYSLAAPGSLTPVSRSVGDTRSEVCWATVTDDGRFAYVTNFGDGTISSYGIAGDGSLELRDPVAGSTRPGPEGRPRRGDLPRRALPLRHRRRRPEGSSAGRSAATASWTPIGGFEGVPETVAGLVAS